MPALEPLSLLLHVSALLCVATAAQTWSMRPAPRARSLSMLLVACAIWATFYAQELQSPHYSIHPIWSSLSYLGGVWVGPMLYLSTLSPAAIRPWWQKPFLHLIFPITILVLVASNPWHGLIYTHYAPVLIFGSPATAYDHGPAFFVYMGISYAYAATASASILSGITSGKTSLKAALTWILALLPPWIASILYVFRLTPYPGLDLTPLAFSVTAVAISLAMRRHNFVDPNPFARSSLVEHLSDGVLVFDKDGLLRDANPAACDLLGIPLAPGTVFAEHLPVDFGNKTAVRRVTLHNREIEVRTLTLGSLDAPLGSLHILHDDSVRLQNEARISLLSQAVEAGPTAMLVTDLRGHVVYVNKRFCSISGYTEEEILGQNPRILNSGYHPKSFFQAMWEKLLAGLVWRGEIRNKRKNGTLYWNRADIAPLRAPTGEITHFVALAEDITERRAMQERLEQMASTDALTGLYNRRFVLQMGQKEFVRHRRNQRELVVAMIDIDHFKSINDQHGHAIGDRALRLLSEVLRKVFREGDLIGRFGGEEFLLIFPDTSKEMALQACERMREKLKMTPLTTAQGNVHFSISGGVALLGDDVTLEALIQRADNALYQAKENGRDRIELAQ